MKSKPSNTSEQQIDFESYYTKVREIEGRIYSDKEVKHLPFLPDESSHAKEWKIRAKSSKRFLNYLEASSIKNILEIGCGNGWFINQCSAKVEKAMGIDVNKLELDQAKRVFQSSNLDFYYWDIFTPPPFEEKLDSIVLNAVVQYFPNFNEMLNRLKELLDHQGEIHLIDSPFYQKNEIKAARQRSVDYFKKMGVPEMAEHYFHHDLADVQDFETLYKPQSNRFKKWIKAKDSPFPWLVLKLNH